MAEDVEEEERTGFSCRRNLREGALAGARVCVRASVCVFLRPTWQPFFTSFTSTDVVGEKLFLKADLKNLRCYKTNTHMCWCLCASVCVCVCVRGMRVCVCVAARKASSE